VGEFRLSYEVDNEVLAARLELLSPSHPHVLMTRVGLAADLRGLGRDAEALALDLDTYTTWQEYYGEENAPTLAARDNVAVSYRLMGDFRLAGPHEEETLLRRREVLGETRFPTLTTRANYAVSLRSLGRIDESVPLHQTTYSKLE
jgi:hypothetical protein